MNIYLKRHFLDRLDDIVAPNYRPSNMDILYTRVETKQAYQTVFHPSKQWKDHSLVLIDVGGQRELRSVLLQHSRNSTIGRMQFSLQTCMFDNLLHHGIIDIASAQ